MENNYAISILLSTIQEMEEEIIKILVNSNVEDTVILDVIDMFYIYFKIDVRGNNDDNRRND